MRSSSITRRLTFYYGITLIILLLGMLAMLFLFARTGVRTASRPLLEKTVQNAFDHIDFRQTEIIVRDDFDLFYEGISLLVYGPDGTLLMGTLPAGFPAATPLNNGRHQTVVGTIAADEEQHQWNVYDQRVDHLKSGIWVRGIYSVTATTDYMLQLIRTALIALPVFVILALALGYALTRRFLRPIHEINQTVSEIHRGRDLSRRIEVREERKDEIGQLTTNFNTMFSRLEASFEKERQFTSDVSHELRTPIAAILAQTGMALEEEADEQEIRQALQRIQYHADNMSTMVAQLLHLTRTDRNTLVFQPVKLDFTELCDIVVEGQQENAESRGITLKARLDPDVHLIGDETMLIRMTENLISNAIRYNKPNGMAMVDLIIRGREAILTVSDSGIGIPKEARERVFQRFFRVTRSSESSEQQQGTGLGLAMVQSIVEVHSGSISVQSEEGSGSVFTVRLPLGDG